MALVVNCTECQARLRLPDELKGTGKTIKCPKCSGRFNVDEAEPAGAAIQAKKKPLPPPADNDDEEEEQPRRRRRPRDEEDEERPRRKRRRVDEDEDDDDDEEEERPRKRRRRPVDEDDEDEDDEDDYDDDRPRRRRPETPLRKRDWQRCRTGIYLVYTAANLVLGAACLVQLAVLGVIVLGWMGAGVDTALMVGNITELQAEVLAFGSFVTGCVGLVFCCFAPPRQNAPVLAITAAALAGASFLFGLIGFFVSPVIIILAGLISVAQHIVFLFFLRALALILKQIDLGNRCRNLAIAYGVSLVVYPLLVYIVVRITATVGFAQLMSGSVVRPENFALGMSIPIVLVMAFGVGLFLSLFIWFMMSLTAVFDGINYEMAKGKRSEVPIWVPLLGGAAFFLGVNFIIMLVTVMSAPKPKPGEPGYGQVIDVSPQRKQG